MQKSRILCKKNNECETQCSERNETTNKTGKCKRKSLYATGKCKIGKSSGPGVFLAFGEYIALGESGYSDDTDKKCKQKKFR